MPPLHHSQRLSLSHYLEHLLGKHSFDYKTSYDTRAIESFQRGETKTFIQHINAAIDIVIHDEAAVVVFSG